MKKFLFLAPFIVMMTVLPFSAAAQTPTDDVSAAAAKAEEMHKKAIDFESPSYFPAEWEAAEAHYTDAGEKKTVDAYNTATNALESAFKLAIPLYKQAREDEIMALRNNLVAGGVKDNLPEYFSQADKTALSALDQYDARDYYTARDTAAKALTMYQAMTSIYNAWLVRHEIEEREFQSYDQDNFNGAGELFTKAVDAYKAENYASVGGNADEALKQYNAVLAAAWAAYAEQCSSKAEAERKTALDIKANIAVKDLFTEADSHYKTAVDIFASKDYEEAANHFIDSEALFIKAHESAMEKRKRAADLIKQAKEKIEESEETARQAEITIKGGTQ